MDPDRIKGDGAGPAIMAGPTPLENGRPFNRNSSRDATYVPGDRPMKISTVVLAVGGLVAMFGATVDVMARVQDPQPPGVVAGPIPVPTPPVDPNNGVGMMIGGAGLLAVVSAIAKDLWQDRREARDYKLKLAVISRKTANIEAVLRLYKWAERVATSDTRVPAPELPYDFDPNDKE